jgi:hypothetical protein
MDTRPGSHGHSLPASTISAVWHVQQVERALYLQLFNSNACDRMCSGWCHSRPDAYSCVPGQPDACRSTTQRTEAMWRHASRSMQTWSTSTMTWPRPSMSTVRAVHERAQLQQLQQRYKLHAAVAFTLSRCWLHIADSTSSKAGSTIYAWLLKDAAAQSTHGDGRWQLFRAARMSHSSTNMCQRSNPGLR